MIINLIIIGCFLCIQGDGYAFGSNYFFIALVALDVGTCYNVNLLIRSL